MLSFQKLDVYRCAIEFLALVLEIIKDIPRGHAVVVDQLKRAALAIPLNIAEGAGRTGQGEAAHSYAIARGEAMECASALDVLQLLKAVSEERHRRACDLLERLVAMLTKDVSLIGHVAVAVAACVNDRPTTSTITPTSTGGIFRQILRGHPVFRSEG